jgi:hypothetical protein
MPERQHADARGLRHPAKVRDRDARDPIDRIDAVELERIDDEVKAVCQLPLRFGSGRRFLRLHCGLSHDEPP